MQRPHERRNLIRELNRLGRRTIEIVHLDDDEITERELIDNEVISTVREDGIEIRQVSHKRFLDCRHVAKASDIAATCDICGSMVCENCFAVCHHCQKCLCRYCYKIYSDEEGEVTLCKSCYAGAKARRAAISVSKAICRFFIKE